MYVPTVWVDDTGAGNGTVLTAARLNNMESGIVVAAPIGEGAVQPGILASTDCALTVDNTAQVTIAAGVVYVTSAGGVLVRTTPTSTVLASIPPTTAGNFRVDEVIVYSTGVVEYLQGTGQGAGATLDTRGFAAPVPVGSRLLYDILVTSGGVLAANVRDRRQSARGASYTVARVQGSDYVRTASTFDWIDAANLRFRIECSGVRLKLRVLGSMYAGASATEVSAYLGWMEALSGVTTHVDGPWRGFWVNNQIYRSFAYETTIFPTAGSHIYGPVFRGDGTNQLTIGAQTNFPLIVELEEIARGNFNNGTS